MRIGLSSPPTRAGVVIVAQFILNLSLAVWLYNEYVHNPFMQAYMSTVWSYISTGVTITAGVIVGVATSWVAYNKGYLTRFTGTPNRRSNPPEIRTFENLAPIDICPYCETPLKTISEGRLQCRNCRRYFKSSLPRVAA